MYGKSRYDLLDDGRVFRFKPNRPGKRLSAAALTVFMMLTFVLILLWQHVEQGWKILFFVLVPYFFLHSLYDIFIRSEVTYSFDRQTRRICREFPFFPEKELMRFEEAVVFTRSINRTWFYALGAKKKYLVTNYRISEDFIARPEKSEAEKAYESIILEKLFVLLETPPEK